MIQRYTQLDSSSKGGWTSYLDSRRVEDRKPFAETTIYRNEVLMCPYTCGVSYDQWTASFSEKSKLSRIETTDRENWRGCAECNMIKSVLLSSLLHRYVRCKHGHLLSIICKQLHREPNYGDVFKVMSLMHPKLSMNE